MIYKMTLKDSTDEMTFNLLEVPIVDKDIEGAVDNVTLDGNQYTDYLYLKKQYIQKWSIMCDEEYERLRGFYTRQFDEAEIPTYELYYGETIYNDYTLSGEYIYADVQGVEPARMSLAQLNGNATQTGTPTPDAPQPISVVTGENVVKVLGKNLWGGLTAFSTSAGGVDFTNNADGSVTASGTATSNTSSVPSVADAINNNWFITLPSGNYTASAGTLPSGVLLQIYNANTGASLGNAQGQFTLTEQTQVYVRIRVASGTTIDATFNVQLELGNQATSYQAFTEQEFEIDLGSIELAKVGTYKDRIYKDGGKWYIEKQVGKVVLDGSESFWSTYGTNTSIPAYNAEISNCYQAPQTSTVFDGLSDHYSPMSQGRIYAQDIDGVSYRVNRSAILIKNIQCSNIATFKTWLSTHPTTVYYALATPTVTEITDQTLIDQLEALVNVSIATGIHNIFTEVASGNLNPVMILNFIEVVSRRVTLVPETPVRLTLTDGGIINACGCRKDVQLTMRETIE